MGDVATCLVASCSAVACLVTSCLAASCLVVGYVVDTCWVVAYLDLASGIKLVIASVADRLGLRKQVHEATIPLFRPNLFAFEFIYIYI